MNYTYIVECKDGSLYTGWTNNLVKRIQDHNAGKGAKYTKGRRPVTLMYYEVFDTKEEALRRERQIKRLSRPEKIELMKNRKEGGSENWQVAENAEHNKDDGQRMK